jgi:hypothetical protein
VDEDQLPRARNVLAPFLYRAEEIERVSNHRLVVLYTGWAGRY